jgi:hypothetical protein
LVVRRRPVPEWQEPAEKFDLLLAKPCDINDGFRSRKHCEQAQQKDLFEWIDHLTGLPRIWKIRKKSQKNKRFAARLEFRPCLHRVLRKNRIRGSRQIQHFSRLSRTTSPDYPGPAPRGIG